jgi:DNA mismatch endonuclease (patch repair protein)
LSPRSAAASKAKRANRASDTKPELRLRQLLWKIGLRFRKNVRSLPGVPDVVFPRCQVAVFCDGDFWHGRNWRCLREALKKGHNANYWIAKIRRNRARDRHHTLTLTKAGWLVLRLWESDIMAKSHEVAERIRLIVTRRLSQ